MINVDREISLRSQNNQNGYVATFARGWFVWADTTSDSQTNQSNLRKINEMVHAIENDNVCILGSSF